MRILVTGGAGCLGSNIVERYISSGHEVCIVDNYATGRKEIFNDDINGLLNVEGTINDASFVSGVFDDFEPTHVIHSAAAYKDPDDWESDVRTNVIGTINVARAAENHSVQRFINFQTALCYGRPQTVPIPVDHAVNPFTSYGISKAAGESYLLTSKLPIISLRLANVTGPRLAIGPIPTFYSRLKLGKDCFCSATIRDFLDMDDFFSFLDLALLDESPLGVWNLSTGVGNSIKEVFDAVCEHLSYVPDNDVPIIPPGEDDVPEVVLDPSETIAAFGWRPKYDFKQTIKKMMDWYDLHGVSEIYSHLSVTKENKD